MFLASPTTDDKMGCRLPPYINVPSMRLAFDRLGQAPSTPGGCGLPLFEAFGVSCAPVSATSLYSVAAAGSGGYGLGPCPLFYPAAAAAAAAAAQHYAAFGLALASSAGGGAGTTGVSPTGAGSGVGAGAACGGDFSSSIADLREKARRHAECLAALLPNGTGL
jgi:hypothetical protein